MPRRISLPSASTRMVSVTARSPLRSTSTSLMNSTMRSAAWLGANAHQQENDCERQASDRGYGLPPGNAICGASASARESSSKYGSSLKPSVRATRTSGNDWVAMFKLRAAPL